MRICPNCSKKFPDSAKFCDACGTKIPDTFACPGCGAEADRDAAFCEQCGTPLKNAPAPEEKAAANEKVPAPEAMAAPAEGKKGLPKKAFLFGGIALAAVAAVVLLALTLLGGGKKRNFALYLQDKEIVFTDFEKDGAAEITSRLMSGDGTVGYYGNHIKFFTAITKDGTKIFYPEKADLAEAEGVTLYCRSIGSMKKEPVKVDSGVTNYAINENGSAVIYTKGTFYSETGYTLYFSDLKEKVKIAGGVSSDFTVSADCKKAVYVNTDGNLYYWAAGKDAVKIAADVRFIVHAAGDMSTVCYITKNDGLYIYNAAKDESEKIASDVTYAQACENGGIYFTRYQPKEITLYDYIGDNYLEYDAVITKPEEPVIPPSPVYPDWYDYDSDDAYYEAVNQYYEDLERYWTERDLNEEEYYDALYQYEEKEYRDLLREQLKNYPYSVENLALYYYDGSAETLVCEQVEDFKLSAYGPNMFVNAFEQPEGPVLTMSNLVSFYEKDYYYNSYGSYEFDYLDEIGFEIARALQDIRPTSYIAGGASLTPIEYGIYLDSAVFTSDGTAAYFVDYASYGDLYKIPLKNGQPGAPERVSESVDAFSMKLVDGRLIYYKDKDDLEGDIYVDEVRAGTGASISAFPKFSGDAVLYLTGDDALMMSTNGSASKISDDVKDFFVTSAGDVVLLKDFSENSQTGTLYLYQNGKRQKLADDVSGLVDPYELEIYGMKAFSFGW